MVSMYTESTELLLPHTEATKMMDSFLETSSLEAKKKKKKKRKIIESWTPRLLSEKKPSGPS